MGARARWPAFLMSVSAATTHRVVAIDGPAASGKSTVAQEVAKRIQFDYLNSGAMYRAVTWLVLQSEISPDDEAAVTNLLGSARVDCDPGRDGARILVDGIDPVEHLREDRVNEKVSRVSSFPGVREILVTKMRAYARDRDVVMEGRDIGSVVFPDTPHKFYIDASPEVRSRRRMAQGQQDEIAARDSADSTRVVAPLMIAKDAHVIDSSNLTIEEVVREIIARLKGQGMQFH